MEYKTKTLLFNDEEFKVKLPVKLLAEIKDIKEKNDVLALILLGEDKEQPEVKGFMPRIYIG